MEIERLSEFVCLAETLNYRMAAQRCYISQSTLSKHITSLEQELGCQLLVRTKADISLTPYGKTLLDHAGRILDVYHQCIEALDDLKSADETHISIGYLYWAAHELLTDFYRVFHEQFAARHVEFKRFTIAELKNHLDENALDFIIDMDVGYEDSSIYRKRPLYRDRYTVIVPKGHEFAQRKCITISDLVGEKLIIPSDNSCETHYRFICAALGPKILKEVELLPVLSDPTEISWYVDGDKGIGLIAEHAYHGMDDATFLSVPIESESLEFQVSIIWKAENETETLLEFVDMFTEMIEANEQGCAVP